jgi:hypothetical protein
MDAEDMQFASNSFRLYMELGCHSSLCGYAAHLGRDETSTSLWRQGDRHGISPSMVVVLLQRLAARRISPSIKQLNRYRDLHNVVQAATDGAIARYYTPYEWGETSKGLFDIESIRIYGLKAEILPFPAGRAKTLFERSIPDAFGRLLTSRLRLGSFLVAEMRRAST